MGTLLGIEHKGVVSHQEEARGSLTELRPSYGLGERD